MGKSGMGVPVALTTAVKQVSVDGSGVSQDSNDAKGSGGDAGEQGLLDILVGEGGS